MSENWLYKLTSSKFFGSTTRNDYFDCTWSSLDPESKRLIISLCHDGIYWHTCIQDITIDGLAIIKENNLDWYIKIIKIARDELRYCKEYIDKFNNILDSDDKLLMEIIS